MKSTDLDAGSQPHHQQNEPAEQQPATSAFPNQMIEQINIALEQKGPGISQPGSLVPSEITSRKRAYTSIKSDEE